MEQYTVEDMAIARLDLGWPEPMTANAYVVDDGTDVTLVDAGYPYNQNRIQDELMEAGYGVEDIDRVLITHYDLDHVGGLARLTPDLDVPVYMGGTDLDLAEGVYDPPLLHHKGLFHRAARRIHSLPDLEYRPVTDGDRIGNFTAHHAPGHNPGLMAYVHDDGAAFVGDLLWGGDELTTPFWGDSYDTKELDRSARSFAADVDVTFLGMGHGTPCDGDAAEALQTLRATARPRSTKSLTDGGVTDAVRGLWDRILR